VGWNGEGHEPMGSSLTSTPYARNPGARSGPISDSHTGVGANDE